MLDKAKRGNIVDRNGNILAEESTVYSVGVVPYKMKDKNKDINKIAGLLNIDRETIEKNYLQNGLRKNIMFLLKCFLKLKILSY